ILISWLAPPPVITTPGTSFNASVTSRKGALSNSALEMTEIEAGALLTSWLNPPAVTTTLDKSIADVSGEKFSNSSIVSLLLTCSSCANEIGDNNVTTAQA